MPIIRAIDEPVTRLYAIQEAPQSDADFSASRRSVNLRSGTREILIEAAAAIRLGFTPRVMSFWWYDASADAWNDLLGPNREILFSDLTGVRSFVLNSADALYLQLADRVGGFSLDLDGTLVNGQAATITFEYLDINGSFTTQAVTDNTASAGAMLAQDGIITLDAVPAAWGSVDFKKVDLPSHPPVDNSRGYWCRITPSATLDAVEIEQLRTLIPTIGSDGDLDSASIDMMFVKATTEYTIPVSEEVQSIEHIAQVAVATTLNITFVIRDR